MGHSSAPSLASAIPPEAGRPGPISAEYTLHPSELTDTLALLVEVHQPAIVWGPSGCAKSQIAQQVAARSCTYKGGIVAYRHGVGCCGRREFGYGAF